MSRDLTSTNPYFIYETEHWTVRLADKQFYLGRSMVFAKQNCEHLRQSSTEQILDFHQNVTMTWKTL